MERDVEFFEDKFSRDDENSNNTTPTSTFQEIVPPPPIMEEPRRSARDRIEKKSDKIGRFLLLTWDNPKTFTESMTSKDDPLWKEAINDEMDSIIGNGTWELADLPRGKRP
uniref:Uncharacterized protein n=1 Tax=Lactuca sativa TaxID=4236 RepID=A0A9R1ULF8_LACSA|nr:hypothetical protein LSAT_V11C800435040 [Lactuca sativa]